MIYQKFLSENAYCSITSVTDENRQEINRVVSAAMERVSDTENKIDKSDSDRINGNVTYIFFC